MSVAPFLNDLVRRFSENRSTDDPEVVRQLQYAVSQAEAASGVGLADWGGAAWEELATGPRIASDVVLLGRVPIGAGDAKIDVPIALDLASGRHLVVRHDDASRRRALALANAVVIRILALSYDGEVEALFLDPCHGGESAGLIDPDSAPELRDKIRAFATTEAAVGQQLRLLRRDIAEDAGRRRRIVVHYDFPSALGAESKDALREIAAASPASRTTLVLLASGEFPTDLSAAADRVDMLDLAARTISTAPETLKGAFAPDALVGGARFRTVVSLMGRSWRRSPADVVAPAQMPALPDPGVSQKVAAAREALAAPVARKEPARRAKPKTESILDEAALAPSPAVSEPHRRGPSGMLIAAVAACIILVAVFAHGGTNPRVQVVERVDTVQVPVSTPTPYVPPLDSVGVSAQGDTVDQSGGGRQTTAAAAAAARDSAGPADSISVRIARIEELLKTGDDEYNAQRPGVAYAIWTRASAQATEALAGAPGDSTLHYWRGVAEDRLGLARRSCADSVAAGSSPSGCP